MGLLLTIYRLPEKSLVPDLISYNAVISACEKGNSAIGDRITFLSRSDVRDAVRCARCVFTSCWLLSLPGSLRKSDKHDIFGGWKFVLKKGQTWPLTRQVRNGRWLCICFSEWMRVNSFPMILGGNCRKPQLQQLTKPLCHCGLMKIWRCLKWLWIEPRSEFHMLPWQAFSSLCMRKVFWGGSRGRNLPVAPSREIKQTERSCRRWMPPSIHFYPRCDL